jgi:hypothetical protein
VGRDSSIIRHAVEKRHNSRRLFILNTTRAPQSCRQQSSSTAIADQFLEREVAKRLALAGRT